MWESELCFGLFTGCVQGLEEPGQPGGQPGVTRGSAGGQPGVSLSSPLGCVCLGTAERGVTVVLVSRFSFTGRVLDHD